MAYVDLNPIRAGIAESPEASEYTSIRERILQAADAIDQSQNLITVTTDTPDTTKKSPPIETSGLLADAPSELLPFIGNERHDQPDGIAFHFNDYLELVDWTGRAIRDDKTGAIPAHFPPILQRLGLDESVWADNVCHFGRRFQRAVGAVERIRQLSQTFGRRWLQGINASKALYRPVVAT